jgi:hypothetical protein
MRKITFHEEADSEVCEAALYYEERAHDLGLAFLDEIEKTSQRVLANPMAYQSVGGEVRQALVAHFPYSVLCGSSPTTAYVSSRSPTRNGDQGIGESDSRWGYEGRARHMQPTKRDSREMANEWFFTAKRLTTHMLPYFLTPGILNASYALLKQMSCTILPSRS